jgi:serine protease AprX
VAATAAPAIAALLSSGPATSGTPTNAAAAPRPTSPDYARSSMDSGVWRWNRWQDNQGSPNHDLKGIREAIGASSQAAGGLDGSGVGVALIDTGIVSTPALPASRIVNGPDLSFESQSDDLRYLDTYGHGTHLAGIIAGNDPADNFKGVAPGVKLTSVKVGANHGVVDVSEVIAGIDWVVEHRNDDSRAPIKVINLAYGTQGTQDASRDPLSFAVENAWRAGIVVVVAAGNDGETSTRLNDPGFNPYVLTVGSVSDKGTYSKSDDELSKFSNRSSARNLDLAAPGETIVSLRDPGASIDVDYTAARVGNRYFRGSGTSQATAVVAGAAALLLQSRPSLRPDQVKALLKSSSTPINKGTAAKMGIGQLNLAAALSASTPNAVTQTWPRGTGTGSLEAARGGVYVQRDGKNLTGENDLFGSFSTSSWAKASAAGDSWQGGTWMGRRMAGDGWTGTSWASRTWGSATWRSSTWGSSSYRNNYNDNSWYDNSWSGRYWSGGKWTGLSWSSLLFLGRYWSGSSWDKIDN